MFPQNYQIEKNIGQSVMYVQQLLQACHCAAVFKLAIGKPERDMGKKCKSYVGAQWEERKKLKLIWEELKVLVVVRSSRTKEGANWG